jgi:two-component system response regulator PilR (NtrC family)
MNEPRVLIIESNDALRVMLFTILRHQPLGVDAAANAEEALERVAKCDYALIILDMDLPDSEASIFLAQFRTNRPEATTFVLAVRDPQGDSTIDPAQVAAVLNKPLEIDTLAEVVRECAGAVLPPENPLPCPPADSDVRTRMDGSGSFYTN